MLEIIKTYNNNLYQLLKGEIERPSKTKQAISRVRGYLNGEAKGQTLTNHRKRKEIFIRHQQGEFNELVVWEAVAYLMRRYKQPIENTNKGKKLTPLQGYVLFEELVDDFRECVVENIIKLEKTKKKKW